MKLPPPVYVGIAVFAGMLLLGGLITCLAALRNSARFFAARIPHVIDAKMSRRGARVFCLMIGAASLLLGLILLTVAVMPFFPVRRLRRLEPPAGVRPDPTLEQPATPLPNENAGPTGGPAADSTRPIPERITDSLQSAVDRPRNARYDAGLGT